jgi:hypothetical protein
MLLSILLVVAAVIGMELVQLFSGSRRPSDLHELKMQYASQDFYRPIERLFSDEDERFLANRGVLSAERRGQLHRARCRVMRLYLQQFRQDFQEAWSVCRLLAPFSEDPNFGVMLLKQLATFYRLYSLAQVRVFMHAYRPADLGVNELVDALRQVRRVAYDTLASVEDLAMVPTAA